MSDNNCQCHTCVLERRVHDAVEERIVLTAKLLETEKERAGLRLRVCEDERDTRELEKKLAEVEAHRDELGTELATKEERVMALLEELHAVRVRLGFVPPTLEEALAPDCLPAPTALDMAERVMTKLALLEAGRIRERSERERQDDAEGKLAKVEAELARIKGITGLWCEDHRMIDGCGFVIVEAKLANTARRLAEVTANAAAMRAVLEFQTKEFHCPEIHATVDNHPRSCPEDSDDPNEWCISAKAQKVLAADAGRQLLAELTALRGLEECVHLSFPKPDNNYWYVPQRIADALARLDAARKDKTTP